MTKRECAALCREIQEQVATLIGTIVKVPGMAPLEYAIKAAEIGKWAGDAGAGFQAAAAADEQWARENPGKAI